MKNAGIAVIRDMHGICTLLVNQEPFEEDDVIAMTRIHDGDIPEGMVPFVHVIVEGAYGRLEQEVWLTVSHLTADFGQLAYERRPMKTFGFKLSPSEHAKAALDTLSAVDRFALTQ